MNTFTWTPPTPPSFQFAAPVPPNLAWGRLERAPVPNPVPAVVTLPWTAALFDGFGNACPAAPKVVYRNGAGVVNFTQAGPILTFTAYSHARTAAPRTLDSTHLRLTKNDGSDLDVSGTPAITTLTRADWQGGLALNPNSRTNIIRYSEDLTQAAAWSRVGVASVLGGFPDPRGGASRCRVFEDLSNGLHYVSQNGYSLPPNSPVIITCWIPKSCPRWIMLQMTGNTGNWTVGNPFAYFNPATGTFGALGPGTTSAAATDSGTGFWKVRLVSCPTVAAPVGGSLLVMLASGDNATSYAGDGSSWGSAWGLSVCTTDGAYIPTAAAPVTLTDYALALATVSLAGSTHPRTAAPRKVDATHLQLTDNAGVDLSGAASPAVSTLTRVDWQGTIPLSLNPRTNYCVRSNSLDWWQRVQVVPPVLGVSAPSGSCYWKLVNTTATGSHNLQQPTSAWSPGVGVQAYIMVTTKADVLRYLNVSQSGAPSISATFDTVAGTFIKGSGVNFCDMTRLTDGGYRCRIGFLTTVATPAIYLAANATNYLGVEPLTGDGISGLWVTDAMLALELGGYIQTGAAVGSLTDLTHNAGALTLAGYHHGRSGAPRVIDGTHLQLTDNAGADLTGAATPSISNLIRADWQGPTALVPVPRTNNWSFSENPAASMGGTGAGVTANAGVAPNGDVAASKVFELATNGKHYASRNSPTIAIGEYVLAYACVKAVERTRIQWGAGGVTAVLGAIANPNLVVDLATGSAIPSATADGGALPLANGFWLLWWRCKTPAIGSGAISTPLSICDASGASSYQGDGASGVLVASMGFLKGTTPPVIGAHIPTLSVAVTLTDYSLTNATVALAQAGGTYSGSWTYIGGLEAGETVSGSWTYSAGLEAGETVSGSWTYQGGMEAGDTVAVDW